MIKYTTRQVFLESDSVKTEITLASENIERRKNLEPEICNTNRLDVIAKKHLRNGCSKEISYQKQVLKAI